MKPLARKKNVIIEELPGETVIFDKKNNKVHCLNAIALTVWTNANGKRSIADLANIVAAESGNPCDEALIELAVNQLAGAGLLEGANTENCSLDATWDVNWRWRAPVPPWSPQSPPPLPRRPHPRIRPDGTRLTAVQVGMAERPRVRRQRQRPRH